MRATIPALAVLALTACGSPAPVAAPARTPDPLNAAACRQWDKAADPLTVLGQQLGTGQGTGSALITDLAQSSLDIMQGAGQVARGDVRQAMDRAVATVQILHTEAAGSVTGSVDMVSEVEASRLAIAEVGRACARVGVALVASL